MTILTAALICFVASLIIPSAGFALARMLGVPSRELSWVMLGFWLPALGAAVLAGVTLLGEPDPAALILLLAETALVVVLVGPKVFLRLGGAAGDAAAGQEPRGGTKQGEGDVNCTVQLVNQAGGSVPWSRSGRSGNFGWYFWVANYYEWTLSLNATATQSSATGTASATGRFSAWHSVTFTSRNASSSATGNVWCDPANDCAADAQGGQDQDTDVDYSSAVLIKGSSSGRSAALEVELAAAVAGQVAIAQVTVGVQGQNVQVGTAISVPNTATDSKKIARTYSYRCSEAPTP